MTETRAVVGLFAGIGGIELGLAKSGFEATTLIENYEPATEVLRRRFPDAKIQNDVRSVTEIPGDTELVTAGFPCQDLSSVGRKSGISGTKSSLVGEVFRLLKCSRVPWVLLENVPFLRHLDRGRALRLIASAFDELEYDWAYRVIDAQAFGLPQRRKRWIMVATNTGEDVRDILLADEAARPENSDQALHGVAHGFYWTEGMRALGWAIDAVPPIKPGSTIGVASPPAIVRTNLNVVTPDLRDAERLQGFPIDWTEPAEDVARHGFRWRLVGNAVAVPVATWVGRRLVNPGAYDSSEDVPYQKGEPWPAAAWSHKGKIYRSEASDTPVWEPRPHLEDFLEFAGRPLSARAANGFLNRAGKGSLRFADGFLAAIEAHARRMETNQ
jgi:DNA (cytosine-5)-methyltransferase 1